MPTIFKYLQIVNAFLLLLTSSFFTFVNSHSNGEKIWTFLQQFLSFGDCEKPTWYKSNLGPLGLFVLNFRVGRIFFDKKSF